MKAGCEMRSLNPVAAAWPAILCLLIVGAGCDVQTDVSVKPGAAAELEQRVTELEGQLAAEKQRADGLERELSRYKQTNVIGSGEDQITFQISTPVACVLIALVLAAAAVLIARIRARPAVEDADD